MLLSLWKHTKSDIANATRVLSKAHDGANPALFQELLQVIRYEFNTKNLGLKLKPNGDTSKPLGHCFSNSDCTGHPVSRISESGFVTYVLFLPVSWQSKVQRCATLSRS